MSLTSQQYAGLADDAYSDKYPAQVFPPGQEPPFEFKGVQYKVLEHASNSFTGYQGTVYQRVDTREIVVAHRGTEGEKLFNGLVVDGLAVDGSMVLNRVNPQARDAIELTRRAIEQAREQSKKPQHHTPEVTVTGHSLGGALAQITAHHFGLRGETFNAYGAASLGYRISGGGDAVLNHVMAADVVSAASAHYGRVRMYASPAEIQRLAGLGQYDNTPGAMDVRNPLLVADKWLGSHLMHNFLDVDDQGRPDRSVLGDPQARQRAQAFAPMIEKYRGDVEALRGGITRVAGNPVQRVRNLVDQVRGPLPAGHPAAEQAREQAERLQRDAVWEAQQDALRQQYPALRPLEDAIRPTGPGLLQWPAEAGQGLSPAHGYGAPSASTSPAITPGHPSFALFTALEKALPGLSQEKVAEVTLAAQEGGIRSPSQLEHVIIHNAQVWVASAVPGERAHVPLSSPAPCLAETLQAMEAFEQQQAQQMAQFRQQHMSASGPSLGRSLG